MAAFTEIDDAGSFFNTVLYTGNGTAIGSGGLAVSVGFQPDFNWTKARDNAQMNRLTDSVRGTTKTLYSDDTSAEDTYAEGLTLFSSDGYTVGNQDGWNNSAYNYASWNWKAGTTSGISGGTITPSDYSINTTSGFGMYKYVGNTTSGATIAHGLGVVPKFIMVKSTTQTSNWQLQHVSTGPTKYLELNSTIAAGTATSRWNDTAPTSSVFSLGNTDTVNDASYTYIAYVWADVTGFSKFASYQGNADADGPFIYTGFKPAWILIKNSERATSSWFIWDDKREGYNPDNDHLYSNTAGTEDAQDSIDILSNGFKIRNSDAAINGSNKKCIFAAFASNPLVSSSSVPGTGRF